MTTRPAAVAGSFYPDQAAQLRETVQDCLRQARAERTAAAPKALIVPHAGYVYSGATAGRAYARLAAARDTIRRVVLLGPAHRVAVRGLALPEADAFATPLGSVPVDAAARARLAQFDQVVFSDEAHATEHSLEVQLPFMQQVLGDFSVVPLVVGRATAGEVAEVLLALWNGPATLIVVSSDLSHYLGYRDAREIDAQTAQAIMRFEGLTDHGQACGATPINALLQVARRRGLLVDQVDLCSSGDTAGERDRVVGYGAWAFYEPPSDDLATVSAGRGIRGRTLLAIARGAIARCLGQDAPLYPHAAFLDEPGASFVTLKQRGELRGCIGSLQPRRALGEDVACNARAAAFSDPRFEPLAARELPRTQVEVSVLSPAQPMAVGSLPELLAALRPGVDGLILSAGARRATFLPQVWDTLPDPRDFVAQLQRKAGLPTGRWLDDLQASRYTVERFAEPQP